MMEYKGAMMMAKSLNEYYDKIKSFKYGNARLKKCLVDKENNTYILYFVFDETLNATDALEFALSLDYFKTDRCGVDFYIEYTKMTEVNMIRYWNMILDRLCESQGRLLAIKDFEIKYQNNEYILIIDKDSTYVEMYFDEIKKEFKHFGFDVNISKEISNSLLTTEEIIERQKEEQLKRSIELQKAAKAQVEERPTVKLGKSYYKPDLNVKAVPIHNIPSDAMGLYEYEHENGIPNFVVEGTIFQAEVRKLTNMHLAEFKITDETDSIVVKRFLRKEEEITAMEGLKIGDCIKVSGKAKFDEYAKDVVLMADALMTIDKISKPVREDLATTKRVELHCHTNMSNMDGITTAEEYLTQAVKWGHKAIAFTDHAGVYNITEVAHSIGDMDIKPIFGLEADFVDDLDLKIAFTNHDINLKDATFVVFDTETTGFSTDFDELLEIGAVKVRNFEIVDEFQTLIKPTRELGEKAKEVNKITEDMLVNAPNIQEALPQFLEFSKDAILVAHNAKFDMGHLYANMDKLNIEYEEFPVIDTLEMAHNFYYDQTKKFSNEALCKLFKIKLENAHRALDDTIATAQIFIIMLRDLVKKGCMNYNQINDYINKDELWKYTRTSHINMLVLNQTGYKNLFKIVSDSLTTHFFKEARVLKSVLEQYREGILVGSGCAYGDVFETALNKSYKELINKMHYYDYIEVQPPAVYSQIAYDASIDGDVAVKTTIKKIIKAADELEKIVVATGDVHYLNKEDRFYRDIYIQTPVVGGGIHRLKRYPESPLQHFRTTSEMLEEFSFLGPDRAYEIVVKNTNEIADRVEKIEMFKKQLFAPDDDEFAWMGVPSIEGELKRMVNERVHQMYGEVLPQIVDDRLQKELNSIITNKFCSVYYMSHLLVKHSNDRGYLVGSRGSVGSSFVATMMGITEVNPLSPHYRCKKCRFSSFKMNEEEKQKYGIREIEVPLQKNLEAVESGFDLPDATCPICGTKLTKDGHDIPFETFLGFKGDKVPDIDLNFSGDDQPYAHLYVRELMGNDYAFRAGTLATVAEKTAYGYVMKYFEEKKMVVRKAEIERLAKKIEGVKRSTGQHPGGIVIVPKRIDIFDVTPIQYPADDTTAEWRTTHFDYHSFESNLLKLDILGHDDPTVIRYYMDYVKQHPDEFPFDNAADIPIDDPRLYQLFCGTDIIGCTSEDILSPVASYAVPELGTNFVRKMLADTKPSTFAELVKISGLSHGTDVWLNNAEALVLGKTQFGKIDFKEVIGCRDDIMVYLMYQGLEPAMAFKIMEFVRKGKPSKDKATWEDLKKYMRERNVPEWYIWSCEQIKYMFPKAHATAYVLSAMRIAWFKLNKPILFYSAYFTIRANQFDPVVMTSGANAIRNKINDIQKDPDSKNKDLDLLSDLEVALEMTKRGLKFKMVDIEKSEAKQFVIDGDSLIMPFASIDKLGENAANLIVEERNKRPFSSKKDAKVRGKINNTVFDTMNELGVLDSLKDDEAPVQVFDLFNS